MPVVGIDGQELIIWAKRRLGELIAAKKAAGELAKGTRGNFAGRDASGGTKMVPPENDAPTLPSQGIPKKLSAEAQQRRTYRPGRPEKNSGCRD